MARFDAKSAECLVLTFKEGLLSSVAHDLKIRVTDFEVEIDEEKRSISARFVPSSLKVVCAMKDGVEAPRVLNDKDVRDIEKNMFGEVLHTDRFPEIRFVSTAVQSGEASHTVEGTLTLHGTARPVVVPVKREGERWVAEIGLNQPDFGVKPFRALLGALKVKPEVRVRLSVPVAQAAVGAAPLAAAGGA